MGATIAVGSLGGAPGVTTLAVALASTWPAEGPAVVVEADASGGDVGAWWHMPTAPGMVELAAAARHDSSPGPAESGVDPLSRSQVLPGGVRVCLAPVTAERAAGAVRLLAQHPRVLCSTDAAVTVVDVGRLTPRTSGPHIAAAPEIDAVLLVTTEDLAQLKRLQDSLPGICAAIADPMVAVVGRRESSRDLTEAIQAPVAARIPLDNRGAALIRGQGTARPGRRRLMEASRGLAHHLHHAVLQPAGTGAS